ncbi:NAD(P)/FAD-dependent oxidoreductase [Streptomyces purpureus]|uniref:hypothetical protein n=1 Tax=Streptomyces purpureus TaxID=1951 RepID=UPI000361DBFE|nr:hypothetical protein [Streptomyces purpureus]
MTHTVIAGASIAGLATALALAATGHRVTVLDRADAPPPPPADPGREGTWFTRRPTVPQGGHSHTLTSLGVRTLAHRAPHVLAAARTAGAHLLDLTDALPPDATDTAREMGDDDLTALACRRPTLEHVLHQAALATPGITLRHATTVAALDLDDSGRIQAVRTSDHTRLAADAVVDATGRRAASRTWLAQAGIPLAADHTCPSGLTGHTRFYRLLAGQRPGPLGRGNAAGDIFDHYAGVLHPGDGDTFSIALATLPGDRALAGLNTPEGFTAAARATPGLTVWLESGISEPISPVHAITAPPNTLRGNATTRQKPIPGLFPVADAACITNPLLGRGMSLALAHAYALADLLAAHDPTATTTARLAARLAEDLYTPWYTHAAHADRLRIARWRAAVTATEPPPPTDTDRLQAKIALAARTDGTVWRGLTRMLMTLATPAEILDDKFLTRIQHAPTAQPRPAGPTRADLVRLVTAAEGAAR